MQETKWTKKRIKQQVLEVVNGLGLDRMPSSKECATYFGNYELTNAITKKCGWYALADDLGLPMKESETQLGKTFEAKASDLLIEKGFTVQRMPQNFPYDLLVDGCVKVDVKASKLYKGKLGDFFSYNLEKPFATCDVYLLITLDENNGIGRVMVVPSKFVVTNTQISVGAGKSKYHAFTDRWDYIQQMVDFWSNVS